MWKGITYNQVWNDLRLHITQIPTKSIQDVEDAFLSILWMTYDDSNKEIVSIEERRELL